MARLRRLVQMISAGLFILGLTLRLTVNDAIDRLAIFFYAMPWPALAVLGITTAGMWIAQRRFAMTCLAGSVISAVMWITGSYERNSQSTDRQDLRIVSWNAEHAKKALPEIIEKARSFDADLLGITETESTEPADAARWSAAFPHHTVKTLPGNMLFITRGEMMGTLSGSLSSSARFNLVQVKFGERRAQVMFVDFDANPMNSRRPAFAALGTMISNLPNDPVIVMGDFNTPRESVCYARTLRGLQGAFDVGGRGFAETWPVPIPVLSLDHIFVSKSLRILRCVHGASLSDHRPVIADLAWQ